MITLQRVLTAIHNLLSDASGQLIKEADASKTGVDAARQRNRRAAVRVIRSTRRDVMASQRVVGTATSALHIIRAAHPEEGELQHADAPGV